MEATKLPVLLLFAFFLVGQRCCGFSVEFIHRDSPRSPFHDPALSPHERMLAAARRSLDSIGGGAGDAAPPPSVDAGGAMSEIVTRSFEYLMSVRLGTPPTQVLAIADTGSDLVWVGCRNDSSSGGGSENDSSSSSSLAPHAVFDPSQSSSYGVVGCSSDACQALSEASCDAASNCQYQYGYGDGSHTVGLLSTETFSFGNGYGGEGALPTRVDKVNFGCSTYSAGTFRADGLVGLGGGSFSLITQLGAKTRLGRKFSYCLVPLSSTNASSALNFGASAVVSGPGAATTPLVDGEVPAYYTVELESVAVGGQAVASNQTSTYRIIVDSGTTLTFLDRALLQPLVDELQRRIALPRVQSPEQLLQVCYDVSGRQQQQDRDDNWGIPDVTLRFGGGAAVTLKPENTFTMVQEGTLCLAVVPVSEGQPVSILGNVAQQNFHVGYDLDARTVTFAPADCTRSSASS